jgi:hypothetical protein
VSFRFTYLAHHNEFANFHFSPLLLFLLATVTPCAQVLARFDIYKQCINYKPVEFFFPFSLHFYYPLKKKGTVQA